VLGMIGILMLVLFPVLIPLATEAAHVIDNWRRNTRLFPVATRKQRPALNPAA
jgi:hypothetical protein